MGRSALFTERERWHGPAPVHTRVSHTPGSSNSVRTSPCSNHPDKLLESESTRNLSVSLCHRLARSLRFDADFGNIGV